MQKTEVIPLAFSPLIETTFYACGVVVVIGAVLNAVAWAAGGGMPWGIVVQGTAAISLFTMPGKVRQVRAEKLAQREAGDGTVTFVEREHVPDSVILAVLFGMLSLVSFVPLFAPAAIAAGTVALCQRRLAGLVGVLLGAGVLAVWVWWTVSAV